jgi:hypothetical protein
MATIEVDFDVFKELTSRRTCESDTYNDVIRRVLKLAPEVARQRVGAAPTGATFKGAFFPDGTQFRGTYKGRTYTAEIKGGAWIDSDGTMRTSPSEAAVKITKKNWNGWLFWHCKRPGDNAWQPIDVLRPSTEAKLAVL